MVAIGSFVKNYGRLIFDPKYQENVTNSLRVAKRAAKRSGTGFYSDIFTHTKDAFKYANKKAGVTPFWTNIKTSFNTLMPEIKSVCKGTGSVFSKAKGIGKALSKRMPLIGVGLTLAFELPNIFSAFKDKGFVGGIAEAGKSTARLGGFMTGMALGQALIPIPVLGGIIGGMAGDWLVSKVVGKSHSEQKAEAEEIAQAQQGQQMQQQTATEQNPAVQQPTSYQTFQPTMTQAQMMQYQNQLYGNNAFNDDFMANISGINSLNSNSMANPYNNAFANPMTPQFNMTGMNTNLYPYQAGKLNYVS